MHTCHRVDLSIVTCKVSIANTDKVEPFIYEQTDG